MDFLLTILVALSAAVLYWPALGNEIVFDDTSVLRAARPYMRGVPTAETYRWWHNPFTWSRSLLWLTYRYDASVHGLRADLTVETRGWHATNILLHALAAALAYALLRSMFSQGPAFLGALVFVAHPTATSSVGTIFGRSSVLCMVFYLAALVAFQAGLWWLAILLGLGAWKSKEEALTLPISAALMWWCAR